MIDLRYSLVIEATEEPDFFSFYSPDLEGFSGVGHSVEDCIYNAKWGMAEHVQLLGEQGLAIPEPNPRPRIIIENAVSLPAASKLSLARPHKLSLTGILPADSKKSYSHPQVAARIRNDGGQGRT